MNKQEIEQLLNDHETQMASLVKRHGQERARQMWMQTWEQNGSRLAMMSPEMACAAVAGALCDREYKAEYQENKAAYLATGMSEADYIATRRVDDGHDKIGPALSANKSPATGTSIPAGRFDTASPTLAKMPGAGEVGSEVGLFV